MAVSKSPYYTEVTGTGYNSDFLSEAVRIGAMSADEASYLRGDDVPYSSTVVMTPTGAIAVKDIETYFAPPRPVDEHIEIYKPKILNSIPDSVLMTDTDWRLVLFLMLIIPILVTWFVMLVRYL